MFHRWLYSPVSISIVNQVCAEQVAACRSLAWSYRGFKCCTEIIRIPWIGGGFWKQNVTWQNIPNIPIMVFSKSWHLSKSFAPSGLSIPIMHIKIRRPQPKRGSAEKRLQAGADEKMEHRENSEGCVLGACQHLPAAFWSFFLYDAVLIHGSYTSESRF